MSDRAENHVLERLAARGVPDPSRRRTVLMALAGAHIDGPFQIDTGELARKAGLGPVDLWFVLIDLHRRDLVHVSNVGGRMTVVFPFDLPPKHPAYVSALPAAKKEAAE